MQLPFKTLRIDYKDVSVSEMSPQEVLLGDPDDLGSFHSIGGIKLHPCLEGIELADTVLHEIIHALIKFRSLQCAEEEDPDVHEERIAVNIAHGLVQVFRDNPAYADWHMEQMK